MRSRVPGLPAAGLVFPLLAMLIAGGCSRKPARFGEKGAEIWVVDDVPYHVLSSHFERGPSDKILYVMKYPVPPGSATTLDKDGAGILTWPLIKYATNNRTYARAQPPELSGSKTPPVLAVDVYSQDGSKFLIRYEASAGN
jgi:hypothetical protein